MAVRLVVKPVIRPVRLGGYNCGLCGHDLSKHGGWFGDGPCHVRGCDCPGGL